MSYSTYHRIRQAAEREAYQRARQLGLSAVEAMDEAALVGSFIRGIAEGLGATAGVMWIAINAHHKISIIERPSNVDPEFFAARFYLRSEDDRAPNFVAIRFAGHDREAAIERLKLVAEKISASNAADQDGGT